MGLCKPRFTLPSEKEALRQQLEQLTQNKGGDCTGQQTDPLHQASSSIQTEHGAATVATATDTAAVAVTGMVGQEIRSRKLSLEGKVSFLSLATSAGRGGCKS